jgi:hypothetical protein
MRIAPIHPAYGAVDRAPQPETGAGGPDPTAPAFIDRRMTERRAGTRSNPGRRAADWLALAQMTARGAPERGLAAPSLFVAHLIGQSFGDSRAPGSYGNGGASRSSTSSSSRSSRSIRA